MRLLYAPHAINLPRGALTYYTVIFEFGEIWMSRNIGPEARKASERRLAEGFFERYLSGSAILDIGYRGSESDALPIVDQAIGVDIDYPGYDGIRLPFDDGSQDAVFTSHCLEHIEDYPTVLRDWYRVLKIGGFLIIVVPHHHLFERKPCPPSNFTGDHKRFYTSCSLLSEVDQSLPMAGYRIRSLKENDEGFDYDIAPREYPKGLFDIELVIEKIKVPAYVGALTFSADARIAINFYTAIVESKIDGYETKLEGFEAILPVPPFRLIRDELSKRRPSADEKEIREALIPIVQRAPFDSDYYLSRHQDIAGMSDPRRHYIYAGYFENREAHPSGEMFG